MWLFSPLIATPRLPPKPSSNPFSSRKHTPGASQGVPSRISPSDLEWEQKYPALFVDITQANNAANFRLNSKMVFNFTSYDIWIAPPDDPEAPLPTRDELADLEKPITFTLDWELRKHIRVFSNGHRIFRIIIGAYPKSLTSSTEFHDLRNYTMNNFRT